MCLHKISGNTGNFLKFLGIPQFLLLVFCTLYFSGVLGGSPVLSELPPSLQEPGLRAWLASGAARPGLALMTLLSGAQKAPWCTELPGDSGTSSVLSPHTPVVATTWPRRPALH